MLTVVPPKYRKNRGRNRSLLQASPPAPPGPTAPVLVSAAFSLDDGAVLTLGFDRAVAIVGFDPAAIGVADGPGESFYDGSGGATLSGANTVVVGLIYLYAASGDDVELTATAGNGIVAVDGGVAWAGASGLVLPFSAA
jgi:hypothetical protein